MIAGIAVLSRTPLLTGPLFSSSFAPNTLKTGNSIESTETPLDAVGYGSTIFFKLSQIVQGGCHTCVSGLSLFCRGLKCRASRGSVARIATRDGQGSPRASVVWNLWAVTFLLQ